MQLTKMSVCRTMNSKKKKTKLRLKWRNEGRRSVESASRGDTIIQARFRWVTLDPLQLIRLCGPKATLVFRKTVVIKVKMIRQARCTTGLVLAVTRKIQVKV